MCGYGVFFGFGDENGIGKTAAIGKKLGREGKKGVANGELGRLIGVGIGICADVEAKNACVDGIGVVIGCFEGENEEKDQRERDGDAGDESGCAAKTRRMCKVFHSYKAFQKICKPPDIIIGRKIWKYSVSLAPNEGQFPRELGNFRL